MRSVVPGRDHGQPCHLLAVLLMFGRACAIIKVSAKRLHQPRCLNLFLTHQPCGLTPAFRVQQVGQNRDEDIGLCLQGHGDPTFRLKNRGWIRAERDQSSRAMMTTTRSCAPGSQAISAGMRARGQPQWQPRRRKHPRPGKARPATIPRLCQS